MSTPRQDVPDSVDSVPGDEIKSYPPQLEVGRTGLRRVSGYVDDEFLPQLRGRKAVQIYREMADNSAVAAAWIYTVMQLLRQIEWRVEAASNKPDDRANAEFVEQNMEDMEHSWGDFVTEVCSMLTFGWSCHEMVYKKREGLWAKNAANRSKFTDGKIGLRKLPIRAQESLLRWNFAPNGDVLAMVQQPAPHYEKIVLPMNKCVLFRTRPNKGSPEGYSLLRPMYRSWFMIKRFEEIEAVGVERDLTGVPIAKVEPKYLNPTPGTDEAKMALAIKQLVTAVRRNEQDGILWPHEVDPDTKLPKMEFELLTSGGSRQFNIDDIIQRYETRMLMSAMADFIMTGHEDSGASYSLHTDKSGIFETGVNGIAQAVADPFNRVVIPQLFALNGMRPEALPKLVPNNVNPPDLTQLGAFLTATAGAGVQWFPDPELENFVRDAARLPKLDPDIEKVREKEQREAAIISLAQQQLAAVQVEQQAQQGELQLEGQKIGNDQQAQQLEAGPEGDKPDPGDPDGKQAQAQAGESTAQAKLGTAQQKVKLDQERQKLTNLKKPPAKSAPAAKKKSPLKKSDQLSAFGVNHGSPE